MNVLYQTREVSVAEWLRDPWKFRERVCQLVGAEFSREKRPVSRKYLHQLAVIRRTTQNGTLRGILESYFSGRLQILEQKVSSCPDEGDSLQ